MLIHVCLCHPIAQDLVVSVMRETQSAIETALQPYRESDVPLKEVLQPIFSVVDQINAARFAEMHTRERHSRDDIPPVKVYPRRLGVRKIGAPSSKSRRAQRSGTEDVAYVHETNIKELLEREVAYNPNPVSEMKEADAEWTSVNRNRPAPRDPQRTFRDMYDGEMWADHPFLGDPDYSGPTRLAFQGYSDDVDVVNAIGVTCGHHKVCLIFVVLLNRSLDTRCDLHMHALT